MKKTFVNPKIFIVDLGDSIMCDIVLASNEAGFGDGTTEPPADARRRTSIWDDEF